MLSALAREVRVQSGPRGMRAVSGPSAPSGMIARLEPPPQHGGPLLDLGRPLIPSLACLSALSAVPAGNCATTGWSRFPWPSAAPELNQPSGSLVAWRYASDSYSGALNGSVYLVSTPRNPRPPGCVNRTNASNDVLSPSRVLAVGGACSTRTSSTLSICMARVREKDSGSGLGRRTRAEQQAGQRC